MNRIFTLLSSLFILTTPLHAGESSSAGGGGVICRNAAGEIKTVKLLDFYEGQNLWGMKAEFGAPELSVEAKLEWALKRMEKLDKSRAEEYRQKIDFFWKNYSLTEAPLGTVPDLGQIILTLEPGCKIEQLAIRRKPTLPFETIFVVYGKGWETMDNDQRAGLVLHEAVYRDAYDQGYRDSKVARFMTALFASQKMSLLSQKDYDKILFDYAMADGTAYDRSKKINIFNPYAPKEMKWSDAQDYCIKLAASIYDELEDSNVASVLMGTRLEKTAGEKEYFVANNGQPWAIQIPGYKSVIDYTSRPLCYTASSPRFESQEELFERYSHAFR